ncbi:MAG TPA: prepilin-type N-terminal cleavage/methylation domain-containing protein [Gemmatimonadaceae bacterium]
MPVPLPLRPSRRHRRSRRGFTFIELLIVMIIVGVVAGMSMIGLRSVTSSNRVKKASRLVATDLQYAFSLAGARRRPVLITWDATNLRYQITNRAGDTAYFTRELGPTSQIALRAGEVEFSTDELLVFPEGLAADTLSVLLHQGADTNRVWLARGGTTRIR